MHRVTRAEVKEAFEVLKSMSATSKEREDAEKRIQYVRDLNGMIGVGWDEGRAVGLEIGRAEGKAKGKAELLVRLLNKKFGPLPPDLSARISCASEDQVDAWSEEVLSARTLGDLFD